MKLLIPTLYKYIRYQHIIKKICSQENLSDNLSKLFGTTFETDWIGRMWVVLNPYVQDMNDAAGSQNTSTTIYQYNKDGVLSNDYAIERWVMMRMNIASEFIVNNNLFEILTYKIKKLDADNNYLFVLQNVMLDDIKVVLKRFGCVLLAAIILLVGWKLLF